MVQPEASETLPASRTTADSGPVSGRVDPAIGQAKDTGQPLCVEHCRGVVIVALKDLYHLLARPRPPHWDEVES